MTRLSAWDGIPAGTLVTLRRGALTGEKVERTKAWTASGPMVSSSGVPIIRVDVDGAVVSYPLERVSLGWNEPVPASAVTLSSALDPPPVLARVSDRFLTVALGIGCAYFVCIGLLAFIGWVLR